MDPEVLASQADGRSLSDVAVAAGAWGEKLVLRLCDDQTRRALCTASKGCQQWVLQAVEQLTLTLLGHSGLSEAAWQRRLTSAKQALAARGHVPGTTALVLHFPTPNATALQSAISSMPEAAGRAVTELFVRQVQSSASYTEGVHTDLLTALPAAFPNLRTLSINRLYGCLPDPSTLTHVRELRVHFCTAPQACWASITALVPQLTTIQRLGRRRGTYVGHGVIEQGRLLLGVG